MIDDVHTRVRMPKALHHELERSRNDPDRGRGRSLTAEIIDRLERSLRGDVDRSADDREIELAQLRSENAQLKATVEVLQKIIIDIAKKAG